MEAACIVVPFSRNRQFVKGVLVNQAGQRQDTVFYSRRADGRWRRTTVPLELHRVRGVTRIGDG